MIGIPRLDQIIERCENDYFALGYNKNRYTKWKFKFRVNLIQYYINVNNYVLSIWILWMSDLFGICSLIDVNQQLKTFFVLNKL